MMALLHAGHDLMGHGDRLGERRSGLLALVIHVVLGILGSGPMILTSGRSGTVGALASRRIAGSCSYVARGFVDHCLFKQQKDIEIGKRFEPIYMSRHQL